MNVTDIAKQLTTTSQTIRNWLDEFGEHINSDEIQRETYGNDSFIVLATIAELRNGSGPYGPKKQGYKRIHELLEDGYRTEKLDAYVMPVDLIPLKTAIDSSKITAELQIVTSERDRLLSENEQQREHIAQLNARINKLERELGRAEGKLETLKSQPPPPI